MTENAVLILYTIIVYNLGREIRRRIRPVTIYYDAEKNAVEYKTRMKTQSIAIVLP